MPPLVIAAGITAAGALAGGALASRSSNKATSASLQANREAIDYQTKQEAIRKAEYDKAVALYKQQWEAWNSTRTALLQRYGVDIAPPAEAKPATTATLGGAAAQAQAGVTNGGIGSFMKPPAAAPAQSAAPLAQPQGRTLGSMMPQASAPGSSRYRFA